MDSLSARRPATLHLHPDHLEEMRAWVSAHAPEEACGILAGRDGRVLQVMVIENELHDRYRYRMQPSQQLQAFQTLEAQGWELLGIFHSHPEGPPEPSPTDIAEAYYPEALHLIWSRFEGDWQCRVFRIVESQVFPGVLTVDPV